MDIQKENVDFGDYCLIEQKRHGVPNELYGYKVVNRLRSNTWIDVPVDTRNNKPNRHDEITDIVEVISCTAGCDVVERFRVSDLTRAWNAKASVVPEGFILIKNDSKTVVAIERMVEQQVEASGMDSRRLERLDGWRIIEAAVEAQESSNEH